MFDMSVVLAVVVTAVKFSVRRLSAIRNAPIAPMPAASVGENVRYTGQTFSTP